MGTQPPAPPTVCSPHVAPPSALEKKANPVIVASQGPVYPSGCQLAAATQYWGEVREVPTFSVCCSRHSSRLAPPPAGTLVFAHAPAANSASAALDADIAARKNRPPSAPAQLATASPQPMGPEARLTLYVVRFKKVTDIAHTRLAPPTRSSEPAQPPSAVHSVRAWGASLAAASSAVLGSPAMAPMRRLHAASADCGATSKKGSVPLLHACTRSCAPTSSAVASHAPRLMPTAPR